MNHVFGVQFLVNLLVSGLTYALVALGIALIFSIMGIINFAHGSLYMLGAFITYYVVVHLGQSYLIAILFSSIGLGLLGFLLEKIIFSRFRDATLQGMIVSLGIMLFIESVILLAFGPRMRGVQTFSGTVKFLGSIIPEQRIFVISMAAFLMTALSLFIKYHKHGQAMRALAQDRKAALLQGISVDRMSSMGFAIGSALAGTAGAMLAPMISVNYFMGNNMVLKAFLVIIIGGLGSIPGAILGGFILGALENVGYAFFSGSWTTLIILAAVLIFLLARPKGVMGREVNL